MTGGGARADGPERAAEASSQHAVGVVVAVPVYNNRATVRSVVEAVLAAGWTTVVVDDGSDDGSGDAVAALDVELLRHERNRGKGAALLTAARWIRSRGSTHMICLDADGQFDARDLGRFRDAIGLNPRALVYGVRHFVAGEVPPSSVFGRSFSNFWTWATTGERVLDSQCGFRAYPVESLLALGIRQTRYDFEVEAMVRGLRAGLEAVAVPVSVTYRPAGGRVTHFHPVLDNLRIARSYSRLVLRGLVAMPQRILVHDGPGHASSVTPLRPLQLAKAVLSEHSSPWQLAFAVALGLFLATLPLIGFHTLAILLAATVLRLNRMVAFSVSHLCAPPFVPAACLEVGHLVLRGSWLSTFNAETLWHQIDHRVVEYLVGTVVVAPAVALAGGALALLLSVLARVLRKPLRNGLKGAA